MWEGREWDALLITDRAVGADQGQKFVFVVNAGKAEQRQIVLGPVIDGIMMVINLISNDKNYDILYLSNYAILQVDLPRLSKVRVRISEVERDLRA